MDRCAFCIKRNPRDRFGYTHAAKDAEGNVTCPFLQRMRCPKCLTFGHTGAHCDQPPYMDDVIAEMELASTKGWEDRTPDERLQYMFAMQRVENLRAKRHLTFHCAFCYGHNPNDSIYRMHDMVDAITQKSICPRLLSITCRSCGEKGHTERYCKGKRTSETEPDDPNLIVDLDSL